MNAAPPDVFVRHPKLVISGVLLVGFLLVLLLAEICLRIFGDLNIHYYTGYSTPGVHKYPYGEIPINKNGYPDEDFDLADAKYRIGYFGDSVTYGVGAGYGFRISDLLQEQFPEYDHWTFAYVGESLDRADLLSEVGRYKIDSVIYLMNLNDILPDPTPAAPKAGATTWIGKARKGPLGSIDSFLRGRSYLYTYTRLGVKNTMQKLGYEAHGLAAFELYPHANAAILDATVERVAAAINALPDAAHARGCVVILPYEMQISAAAAAYYEQLGFKWEPGFLEGSAQARLMEKFAAKGIATFDARDAFKERQFGLGEAFVFDKGDKVDWNHPNRTGHAAIAAWLQKQGEFVAKCIRPPQ